MSKTNVKKRVVFYVDGYNLYHSIASLNKNHLKWIDLRKLFSHFIDQKTQKLEAIYYVTAKPVHTKQCIQDKHEALMTVYQRVLKIKTIYGKFKPKERQCKRCQYTWTTHEEKESDVNLAVEIIRGTYDNEYDLAFIVSQDSDMAPAAKLAVKLIKSSSAPDRKIKLLTPPNRYHSRELSRILSDTPTQILETHLEQSLLAKEYKDKHEKVIVTRPADYDPPV